MNQVNSEAPGRSGLFGWLKSLVRKDKDRAPAPGGTAAATTTTSIPAVSTPIAAPTPSTTTAPIAPATPTTPRASNSRKRIAAEDILQATSPGVAASRPDNPAAFPRQPPAPSQSPSPSQLQSQSQAHNLLRAQTWISDGPCSQTGIGAGSPRLDAVEDCLGDVGRWPDSPRQERPGVVQPAARHATLLSAPLDSPRTRQQDNLYEKARPSGGHTAVEMLDPRSIQQSFVKARMANNPQAGPLKAGLATTPRTLAGSCQQVPFPRSADDVSNSVDPAIAETAAATGPSTSWATVPCSRGSSAGGGGYDGARTAATDGIAGGGGPSLRPTAPAAAAAGPSRSRLSGSFPAAVGGYGSGVPEKISSGIPAVAADSGNGGPQKTTTTTTKSSSTNHSSKTTTNGPDGTTETVRKSSVQEQSSHKVMHQVSKPGEDLEDEDVDNDADLEDLEQRDGGGRCRSAVRGRRAGAAAAAAAVATGEWPEQLPGARRSELRSCRESERKDVESFSRHVQEQSEETSLQRFGGGGGGAAGAPGGGPEIITTTTRRENRREEEEFQKVVSSSSRQLVVKTAASGI
ncbi:hypothetical protein Vretimale_19300 [Volvox reticuliferus]|uniref:Uncharacterized protein n=1 Tax=Volvox reticuliferus TaxID=1737510 RepID=A0A8J4GWH9_9CHLO|nr:hypothetical protein Vretifemale_17084 [Volvox reticuliferus]GIM16703.1 hypothetical protein Vretimale_19300 [Volvox reticuliferus]